MESTPPESSKADTTLSTQRAHLASVQEWWRAFDLDGRRLGLDQAALEVGEAREASQRNRKALLAATQGFKKKSSAEEKAAGLRDLLKVYQGEIDNLTRRAKAADGHFLALYRGLFEAPDPAAALAAALAQHSQGAQAGLELERCRRDLAQYEREFAALKNQEVTIRRLEEQIEELEANGEDKLSEKLDERVAAAEAAAARRASEAEDRAREAEARALAAEAKVAQAERARDQARADLFEAAQAAEEQAGAAAAERDLLAEANDQLQAQSAALQRELAALKGKLAAGPSAPASSASSSAGGGGPGGGGPGGGGPGGGGGGAGALAGVEALEQQLADALAQASRAERRLGAAELAQHQERARAAQELRGARAEAEAAREEVRRARLELDQRPAQAELDALHRQLRVLRESAALEDPLLADPDLAREPTPEDTAGHAERNMEHVMILKVRRLEGQVKSLTMSLQETQEESQRYQTALAAAEASLEEKHRLVSQLEDQLAESFDGGGGAGAAAGGGGGKEEGLARLLGGGGAGAAAAAEEGGGGGGQRPEGAGGGGESMLKIVRAQRDRFRGRIQELERDRQRLLTEALGERTAAEALQRDNLQLYEKIKFLQAQLGRRAATARPSPSRMEAGRGGSVDEKYSGKYEQGLNPFKEFAAQERARKFAEMSLTDRVALTVSRTLLASKAGRTFAFFYILSLHILVFATLYLLGHAHAPHATDCRMLAAAAAGAAPAMGGAGASGPPPPLGMGGQ